MHVAAACKNRSVTERWKTFFIAEGFSELPVLHGEHLISHYNSDKLEFGLGGDITVCNSLKIEISVEVAKCSYLYTASQERGQ